ncbi:MAG: hypothetical protein JNM80_08680 [Phycisphaerae bacterium]|nr:hypothetical protein [Phycisphaerae bacterium]
MLYLTRGRSLAPALGLSLSLALSASAQPLGTIVAGGAQAAGVMFDLTSSFEGLLSSHALLAVSAPGATQFSATVWHRQGSYVGHESDPSGWTVANVTQGPFSGGFAHCFMWLPPLPQNATIGVFIQITSSPSEILLVTPIPPAASSYSNAVVTLSGGAAKGPGGFAGTTMPDFMVNGTFYFKTCYANCDGSTFLPILTVMDFICFNNLFASGAPSANCDRSTIPPMLNVADFVCFLNAFVAGCSAP